MSISILKHVNTFVQPEDKLDHLLNWSRLEMTSQGGHKKCDQRPVLMCNI